MRAKGRSATIHLPPLERVPRVRAQNIIPDTGKKYRANVTRYVMPDVIKYLYSRDFPMPAVAEGLPSEIYR